MKINDLFSRKIIKGTQKGKTRFLYVSANFDNGEYLEWKQLILS